MLSSASLNTSKKQLHMEQFLLKTILSLAEQFYNQDWKEMHTEFGRKGEKREVIW